MTTTTTEADTGADPADLAGMFTAYGRELLRYCTRRVGEQVAEDVVAETFLVAYEQRFRYDPTRGGVLPWLYGIATNLLRRHRRQEVRALRALADTDPGADAAGDRIDAQRTVRKLAAVLAGLPRRQRDVLLLFAVAELDYAEIAMALDIPPGTVRSALHRARAKVRAALTPEGETP
ncbi:RNA polymerase sigma-70 factor (ECF subfamily) [Asanoa ferruginea]|uniref:RNA polymerase sigma-70 factor (ECF subfamily) n=1 Tax=Asanoa ferruginea TaxID=53367 RepID=A0A3D9ZMF0_9ACTN|nr:RNA polymerase sigma factor [Asanoa ferruginea]REF97774.1 RNA polymerase sigma-70 factor (ECF subfamily) [Asanoa ferruginea]GIF51956.1 DNA-directed RNA polymerase sigma-70 factor [Asanoa ferruginea]